MKACITLLIVVVIILHSVLCYRHTNVHSLHGILDRQDRLLSNRDTDKITRQTEVTEQLSQPSPFTIVEVQRQVLEDKLKFTVKYESTVTPVKVNWYYVLDEPGITNTKLDNGVYETSAWTSPFEKPNYFEFLNGAVLILTTPDERESITVTLYFVVEDAVVTAIPVPRLDVEPVGDFVYEEGEDLTFKVRVQESMYRVYNEDEDGFTYFSLYMKYFLLDLETGDEIGSYADLLENKKYEDYQEFTMKLNTSARRISGAFSIEFQIWNADSSVIESVTRTKDVILRPSTQVGPLPDGFLGILANPTQEQLKEGKLYCGVGEECPYRCVAVGSDIAEMKVERLQSDGTVKTLGEPGYIMDSFWSSMGDYVQEENFFIQVRSLLETPEKIQCTAKNAEGKVVTKEIPLIVYAPADIIGEDSGIELVNAQDDASVKSFTITCTVKGDPQPNVTFSVTTRNGFRSQMPPDEIVVIGDITYKMILHESIDASEFMGDTSGGYLHVECQAWQESPISYRDWYNMQYPLFGSFN